MSLSYKRAVLQYRPKAIYRFGCVFYNGYIIGIGTSPRKAWEDAFVKMVCEEMRREREIDKLKKVV